MTDRPFSVSSLAERITGVAMRLNGTKETKVFCSMEKPARHGDLMRELDRCGVDHATFGDQGFVSDDGKFLTREEAAAIVGKEGELFSEDLW